MSKNSESVLRHNERKRCETLGIPVPDWARLRPRGKQAIRTHDERVQYKREYAHKYYLAHRGANVKNPRPGRTKLILTPEQREERRIQNIARSVAWHKSHPERVRECRRINRRKKWATDPAWRARMLAAHRKWYRNKVQKYHEYTARMRQKVRDWYLKIKEDPIRLAELRKRHNESARRRRRERKLNQSK